MQLKKQAIRKMPTYDEKHAPQGIRRSPSDFNQKNNHTQRNRNAKGDSI